MRKWYDYNTKNNFLFKKKIVQAIWDDLNGSISTANETDKNPGSYRSFPKI